MNQTSSSADRRALRLALDLAANHDCRISRQVIADHFEPEGNLLISKGILAPDGHGTDIATPDDLAAAVEWSGERGSFGYFSETDGWVDVPNDALTVFALQVRPFVTHLVAELDLKPARGFHELVPDVLWELGSCRLPGRAKRVEVWVARRLHDDNVWRSFVQASRDRPTQELRAVFNLSEREITNAPFVANHAVIAVGSVLSAVNPFQIDAGTVAARLRMKLPQRSESPITVSADGGHVVVRGKAYTFRGPKQRAVIRILIEAWDRGEPRCLTEQVLLEAESGETVGRLARAFKGHPNWHEIIEEQGGFCWLRP